MIKLKSGVKELLKAVCQNNEEVEDHINSAKAGLSKQYTFYLAIATKFGVPITIDLTHEDCTLEPDYNKWYDREDFDKYSLPENSIIIEVTNIGVVLSEESKYISELDDDTVKFMVIDLKGVLD